MNIIILILLLLIPSIANAEYLGCFEPSETVYATVQFNGVTGEVAATSVSARVLDPDDTSTPTKTLCASGCDGTIPAVDGTNAVGLFRGSFSVGASPLAGTWTIRYKGTVDGNVQAGSDTFHVVDTAGDCASRTGVVTASGTVTTVTNGVTLADNAITAAKIVDGTLGAAAETYLATGTEGAGTSTQTTIYTSLSVVSTRKYSGMCLWAASNDERRLIISVGNGVFTVRGFSVAPTDGTELRIYTSGCN